ncbi:MAG: hypothetical protein QNJ65_08255 [Xenococcaceae cyanobacterium MO_234.B1]|nr:hypothetical protein [Xenococcaceae cyanobacterium MO_234.B1]
MSFTAPTESTAAQEFANLIKVRSPVVGNRALALNQSERQWSAVMICYAFV